MFENDSLASLSGAFLIPEHQLYRQPNYGDGGDASQPQADEPEEFSAEAVRAAQW
ncbi:hypothetical protein SJ05684_c01690 [Sinorhizobium sojae CCBAU 05684]|uniref:Uncharacterized protein n=1 Tax=Sinorhizobium sojae CCBAU 05684 TaxID=716928 RepID=A0A249P8P9_9HYPH|nr:hypothetical protein SJ05684_c01690 [Sinorhizobium sojae CCBAU 05684]